MSGVAESKGGAGAMGRPPLRGVARAPPTCCSSMELYASASARPASPMSMSWEWFRRITRPFCKRGPDFEGHIRQLALLYDGSIHNTAAPARALCRGRESRACGSRSGADRAVRRTPTPYANAVPGPARAPRRLPDRSCRWCPRSVSAPTTCVGGPVTDRRGR